MEDENGDLTDTNERASVGRFGVLCRRAQAGGCAVLSSALYTVRDCEDEQRPHRTLADNEAVGLRYGGNDNDTGEQGEVQSSVSTSFTDG